MAYKCSLRAGTTYRVVTSGKPPRQFRLSSQRVTISERLKVTLVWEDDSGWAVYRRSDGQLIHVADGDDAGHAKVRSFTSLTGEERARVVTFGRARILPNREATAAAYAATPSYGHSGPDCGPCAPCRNWDAQRERWYPPDLITFLESLGVDWRKESEVNGSKSMGTWFYSAWLQASGALVINHREELRGPLWKLPVIPGLTVGFVPQAACEVARGSPVSRLLATGPWVSIDLEASDVPWVLDEPEPEWARDP